MEDRTNEEFPRWLCTTALGMRFGEVMVQTKVHEDQLRLVVGMTSEADQPGCDND